MSLKSYRAQHFSDVALSRMEQNVQEWANQVSGIPILDGVLLTDLDVSTTATWFAHGLGRQPRGWMVVDKNADARIWRTDWNSTRIQLDASSAANISIWVF